MNRPSLFESFERRVLFSGAGQDVELPGQVSAVALQSPMQATVVVQFEAETQSLSTTSKNTYLSAKIIGGAPTVGGTVRFYSGEVLIGSAMVRSSGQADLSLFLPVTQHQLRAEYSGDEAHAPAASAVVHYEAPPLYASKGKTYRGEDGAVYVDYSDREIVPTGYIYFMDGPSAYDGRYFARAPLVNGIARLDTLVGYDPNYYLAYGYGGDENYRIDLNRLGMLPVPLLESRPATAQLILPAEPIQAGHTARYTLALRDPDLKPGEWFGGRFDIEVNGEFVTSARVGTTGWAVFELTLPEGEHAIRAVFNRLDGGPAGSREDSPFHASGATATAVVSVPSAVTPADQPEALVANDGTYMPQPSADVVRVDDRLEVRFKDEVKPTGTVYFITGPTETDWGWKVAAPIVDGVAVLDEVPPTAPVYLSWFYSGDENYAAIPGSMPRRWIPMPIKDSRSFDIQITPPEGPLVPGQPAKFTVQFVDPQMKAGEWFGGHFTLEVDGKTSEWPWWVSPDGSGEFTLNPTAGTHTVRVHFHREGSGSIATDPFHADTVSQAISFEVTPGEQQVMGVSVKAEPQLNTYNSRFTATIDAAGAVGGTVSFYADGQLIGTVPVGQNNQAVLTVMLPGGMHTIRAEYSGDATYAAATSADVTYQAYKLTIGVGSAKITREADGSVRLDFTGREYPPTGVIYFADGPVANAQTAFAIVPIVDGVAVLRVAPPNNPVYIAYGYSGDDYYQPQFNRIDVVPMPIIDHRPVTVTITPPAEGFTAGEKTSVEFWITDPQLQAGEWYGGSVTIEIDGRVIATPGVGSNGRAVASLTLLPGSHEIRATYNRVPASTVYSVDPFHASGATAAITVEVAGSLQPGAYALTLGYSVGPEWEAIASADFNGDGTPDLLFRHLDSGKAYLWLLKGHQVAAQGGVAASAGWRAAGASDFDGDGKADILWANDAAGKQAIWQMNGTVIRGFTMLNHAPASPVWRLESVMDLDDDGDDDLLWRNVNTDATFAWFLQGTCVVGGSAL